jgi:hypothetical protein
MAAISVSATMSKLVLGTIQWVLTALLPEAKPKHESENLQNCTFFSTVYHHGMVLD